MRRALEAGWLIVAVCAAVFVAWVIEAAVEGGGWRWFVAVCWLLPTTVTARRAWSRRWVRTD